MHLLILKLTVSASKLSFIFFIFFHIITFKIFFAFFPYFVIEPSTSMYFVYLSGMRCFSPSPKKTHLVLLFFIAFFTLRFLLFVVDRIQEFPVVRLFLASFRLFHSILVPPIFPQISADVRNYISLGQIRIFSCLLMLSFSLLAYRQQSLLVLVFKIQFLMI